MPTGSMTFRTDRAQCSRQVIGAVQSLQTSTKARTRHLKR